MSDATTAAIPRTYPEGVPSWVQLDAPDPHEALRFYGSLFGWEAADPSVRYLFAQLGGQDVAGIAPSPSGQAAWSTYIACDSADAAAQRVRDRGGVVLREPEDAGPIGRWAVCADRHGVEFRLWQAGTCLGAQRVNLPGSWNFSVLLSPSPEEVIAFYAEVFGWALDPELGAGMIRLPGYGDHLAATSDPDIHERQAFAPEAFADVIAGAEKREGTAQWEVRFTVADRDASVALAIELGATELDREDGPWTRQARLRDPFGAVFVVSQFDPQV
jgi:predicted enzyme related to lactoylglutathione lyase